MSDPEITPSHPAQGAGENPDAGRQSGDAIVAPEEEDAAESETLAADFDSAGAPEPAGDDSER